MKKGIVFLLAGTILSGTTMAETLNTVSINGTARIENQTVMNYLNLKTGNDISDVDIDKATKTLFGTGLFSDVKITMDNGNLTIKVQENPIVHNIYFEGNKKLDNDALKNEIMLKPRTIYTLNKIQGDAERLLEVYKRNGRFGATVTPKIIKKDQNRVDVIFEIDEGNKTTVKSINVIGNSHFSDDELKDVIITKESAWYRFLNSTDTYDPDRLNYDKELLRRFYLQNGYVDFKVKNAVAELTPNKEGFIITFDIEEGNRYKFIQPDIKVNLTEYKNTDTLQEKITFKNGMWFNADLIESTITNLNDHFSNLGYAFVDTTPHFDKDEKNKTVKITFSVAEGEKVFVNKIDITGNSRTLDKVIRREFRIKEGDAFNASKLRRSKQRVENLDYFEKVDLKTTPVYGQNGKTDISMDVTEKATGSFSIGVGWSSYDGLLFDTGIQERNILGTGNTLGLNMMLSQREQQYTVGLTNPYFMDKNLLAGIDIFHTTLDNEDYSSYKSTTTGGAIRFGWNYTDYLRQSIRYTLQEDEVRDIEEDASIYIKEQEGRTSLSMIGQEISWDKRDNRINPTQGFYTSFSADYAGIGADTKFVRLGIMGIQYFEMAEDVVFSIRGDAGHIWGTGDQDVRINHRYYLGDSSFRGFEYGGIGARDKATGDALGGNWYTTASAEIQFPLGLPKELGIKGKVFSDAGFIGKPDGYNASTMNYSSKMRMSAGTGIMWQSPMGMINLDFAWPIIKEDFDETKVFRLNFGKAF
ncbi:MAG: outer membrane protein assembly factor BamA [Alphaproteobacteria bacterium]|nr:outer membrane protein assembly factor BamA [Alphaproteobacteria bacterium]